MGVPGEPGGLGKPTLQQQVPGLPSKALVTTPEVAPSAGFSTGADTEGNTEHISEERQGPCGPMGRHPPRESELGPHWTVSHGLASEQVKAPLLIELRFLWQVTDYRK